MPTAAPSLEVHHARPQPFGAWFLVCARLATAFARRYRNRGRSGRVGRRPLALVGEVVALVGEVVALVGGPPRGCRGILGPRPGRLPDGPPGRGGLQRLLSLTGPRLSARTRASLKGQSGGPAPWAAWTTSWARSATCARTTSPACGAAGKPHPGSPPGWRQTPPWLPIQTRMASARRNWAPQPPRWPAPPRVLTSLGSHHRERPQRLDLGSSPGPRLGGIHIQVPTDGWPAARGTLNPPPTAAGRPPRRAGPNQLASPGPRSPPPCPRHSQQAWAPHRSRAGSAPAAPSPHPDTPPTGAAHVLMGQGEAGPIHPPRPSAVASTTRPKLASSVTCLGQGGPQLPHGPRQPVARPLPSKILRLSRYGVVAGRRWSHALNRPATGTGGQRLLTAV